MLFWDERHLRPFKFVGIHNNNYISLHIVGVNALDTTETYKNYTFVLQDFINVDIQTSHETIYQGL